jgi:hypothetical protein
MILQTLVAVTPLLLIAWYFSRENSKGVSFDQGYNSCWTYLEMKNDFIAIGKLG